MLREGEGTSDRLQGARTRRWPPGESTRKEESRTTAPRSCQEGLSCVPSHWQACRAQMSCFCPLSILEGHCPEAAEPRWVSPGQTPRLRNVACDTKVPVLGTVRECVSRLLPRSPGPGGAEGPANMSSDPAMSTGPRSEVPPEPFPGLLRLKGDARQDELCRDRNISGLGGSQHPSGDYPHLGGGAKGQVTWLSAVTLFHDVLSGRSGTPWSAWQAVQALLPPSILDSDPRQTHLAQQSLRPALLAPCTVTPRHIWLSA